MTRLLLLAGDLVDRFPDPFPPPFATGWGDDPYGLWADLEVVSSDGSAIASQRLRWIEPGRFLMGSPESEAGRREREGPQHEVTISNGFWLFDTPCTQSLWQAVMGENPSWFRSPERPVEQVSWTDVQEFLKRLNAQIPGLNLMLPTEAEWEYGCRAGADTASANGDLDILGEYNAPALDPIAWYGGNSGVGFELENGLDSTGWQEKQVAHTRAGTHPVARKAANCWGLYDMLGNVWEWCRDGQRPYRAESLTDPCGPTGSRTDRLLRGGSWSSPASEVRAAYREALFPPGTRDASFGFRCTHRQAEQESLTASTTGSAG